ncbi:hypothetical protein J9253_01220 [Thiothrix litoralis]|uniref:Uncharacterized protein n=2 Tax=Thiothrix litoralis TaxID=2891210 RepID=A0ABX7WSP2_9GAMM|nr:hypothetical protein [Thiothrix litoralis]QTR46610.1 hypothetical protein J9253_01220 [Thiothrix litoralis]
MTEMNDELKNLLWRSIELELRLLRFMQLNRADQTDRTTSSRIMCGIGFEHAESVKMLIAGGNFTSAISLLRLQYEALVRGIWLHYAATDTVIARLMGEFNHEKANRADRLPLMAQMVQELEGKPPAGDMKRLLQFKEYSWKPLSSYVYGGIHVLHRHSKGYLPALLHQAVKASNDVSIMLALHLARLSGKEKPVLLVPLLEQKFADCLLERRPQASV